MRLIDFAEREVVTVVSACVCAGRIAVPHVNDVPFEECPNRRDVVAKESEWLIKEHQRCLGQEAFCVQFGNRASAEHVEDEGRGGPHEPDESAPARVVGRGMLGAGCIAAGCAHGSSIARDGACWKPELW